MSGPQVCNDIALSEDVLWFFSADELLAVYEPTKLIGFVITLLSPACRAGCHSIRHRSQSPF
jgi:hypothetical protein